MNREAMREWRQRCLAWGVIEAQRQMGVVGWREARSDPYAPRGSSSRSFDPVSRAYLDYVSVEQLLARHSFLTRAVMVFLYVRPHLTDSWLPLESFATVVSGQGSEEDLAALNRLAKLARRELRRSALGENSK